MPEQSLPAMNSSRDRILFWCLLAAQAAGSQIIIWTGVPIYQRLHVPGRGGATPKELAIALAAVALMQLSYWLALPLKQRLRFRRNVVLGHVLVCIGELSLFLSPPSPPSFCSIALASWSSPC